MISKRNIKSVIGMTIGTAIASSAIFFFMMPNNVVIAGVAGLSVMFNGFIPISVSAWTMIFNVLCLILGFIFVGKEFSGKTVYISILLPLIIKLYEIIFPDFESITGDYFIDLVCYVFFVSLGIGMLFTMNASSGGTDIIAKILNKYLHIDLGAALSIIGVCIVLPVFFIYDVKTGVLAIIGTYANGVLVDHFIFGFSARKKVCIISDNLGMIKKYIVEELNCDATVYESTGAFKGKHHDELEVIVSKSEYPALMTFVSKNDPEAFVTVYNVHEIIQKPKKRLSDRQPAH